MIIKITLNPNDPFDGVILSRIKDETNRAAALKHIAYEAIKGRGIKPVLLGEGQIASVEQTDTVSERLPEYAAMDRDINLRADRLLENL